VPRVERVSKDSSTKTPSVHLPLHGRRRAVAAVGRLRLLTPRRRPAGAGWLSYQDATGKVVYGGQPRGPVPTSRPV